MADFQWVTPPNFSTKESIGKDRLNTIMENMRYLFRRPRSQYIMPSGTIQTSSTTFVPVSTSSFRLSLNLPVTCSVAVWFSAIHTHSANNYGETMFDVLLDSSLYLSSLTSTPLTDGITRNGSRFSAGTSKVSAGFWIWEEINSGNHNFDLAWKDDGTGNSIIQAGSVFGVMQL